MQKASYFELTLRSPAGAPAANIEQLVQDRVSGTHDGLEIRVLRVSPDQADPTAHHVVVYVEGDQPAPEDFKKLTTGVIQKLWSGLQGVANAALATGAAAPGPRLEGVDDWEGYDTAQDTAPAGGPPALALAPNLAPAFAAPQCFAPVTGGAPQPSAPLPADQPRPNPLSAAFHTCPPQGEGGDAELNALKNRTDDAVADHGGVWLVTTVGAILALDVPPGLPTLHSEWSPAERAAIGHFEGLPLQVVGFLAGARTESGEACNCRLQGDSDFHLWLVDVSGTERKHSVVAEVTPRVRANHPGWAFNNLCQIIQSQTSVRISGWLMMDPQHAADVGQSRGSTWEIHPIIAIDVDDGTGNFVPLDTL
jgi:hypothetical protein